MAIIGVWWMRFISTIKNIPFRHSHAAGADVHMMVFEYVDACTRRPLTPFTQLMTYKTITLIQRLFHLKSTECNQMALRFTFHRPYQHNWPTKIGSCLVVLRIASAYYAVCSFSLYYDYLKWTWKYPCKIGSWYKRIGNRMKIIIGGYRHKSDTWASMNCVIFKFECLVSDWHQNR